MIRVVIDTNIVISALLRAGSLPEAVINLVFSGMFSGSRPKQFLPNMQKCYSGHDSPSVPRELT
jgi:predicted nucleic acid-binding protein